MLLEAFKAYDIRASFNTVTKDLLGGKINVISNISVYFVGGILLYAYITSAGLMIYDISGINARIASILFVLAFSVFVWHSTKAVDRISVVLIAFMVLSFCFGVLGLTFQIDAAVLFDLKTEGGGYVAYALAMFPVAVTSFGYHHSVASMRAYYGEENKAKHAILGGTTIALCMYLLWLFSVFGSLPRERFAPVIEAGGEVNALLAALGGVIRSDTVAKAIHAFSMAAILSSFIGVGLGVFDYLADFFGFDNSRSGRAKSWGVTFIPPLALSLLFPFGFLIVIGYAGAVAVVWTLIVPALLAHKSRKLVVKRQGFTCPGGKGMIVAVILFGILAACFHFMFMMHLLPSYRG